MPNVCHGRYVGIQPVSFPVARNIIVLACVWTTALFHGVVRRASAAAATAARQGTAKARQAPPRDLARQPSAGTVVPGIKGKVLHYYRRCARLVIRVVSAVFVG